MNAPRHILIAPLDWGLGHTTRCIPIIRRLLECGHKVTVAGNDAQKSFLKPVFPQISTVHLEGYDVRYGRGRGQTILRLLGQMPGIQRSIVREQNWLRKAISQYGFDGVISDNRYGLYSEKIPSVILTHQLAIHSGLGWLADKMAALATGRFLARFQATWIVDTPDNVTSLGGALSHPPTLPANAHYIGLLSALDQSRESNDSSYLLVLLSGPEPQRTMLSDKLWEALRSSPERVVFVEGTAGVARKGSAILTHFDRILPHEVAGLMSNARAVICRSGYSTLMDLCRLGRKAVLIPTPGQGEQEYLARRCAALGMFASTRQDDLQLSAALAEAEASSPGKDAASFRLFEPVLDAWVGSL